MPRGFRVRLAEPTDAAGIARVYNQGIDERQATFETEPQTEASVRGRLQHQSARFPAVVVVGADGVLGFAWTSTYRPRRCYEGVAECSVYVASEARRRGVGRLALTSLIEEAERRGFTKLVSRIFPDNVRSRRLCASVGFREVGTYVRHGKLDGRWMDCVIVERLMGEAAQAAHATP
jgi:phosphinothricin acetyltransferase